MYDTAATGEKGTKRIFWRRKVSLHQRQQHLSQHHKIDDHDYNACDNDYNYCDYDNDCDNNQ